MPLMRCPDCGKEISESAIACPNCGLPRPQYEQMSRERRLAEEKAAATRTATIRQLYMLAGLMLAFAVVVLLVIILGEWSRENLAFKGRAFVGAALAGGSGYGMLRHAKRLKEGA